MAGCSHTRDTTNHMPPSCSVTERHSHRDVNWEMGRPAEHAGASPVVPWFRTGFATQEVRVGSLLGELIPGATEQLSRPAATVGSERARALSAAEALHGAAGPTCRSGDPVQANSLKTEFRTPECCTQRAPRCEERLGSQGTPPAACTRSRACGTSHPHLTWDSWATQVPKRAACGDFWRRCPVDVDTAPLVVSPHAFLAWARLDPWVSPHVQAPVSPPQSAPRGPLLHDAHLPPTTPTAWQPLICSPSP